MKEKTNIKVNYLYNLSYQIMNMIIPLITTPYISRVLGADRIGLYSYTLSIVTYFAIFINFGIPTYGQLVISKNRDDKEALSILFWELFTARLISGLVFTIIYILMVFSGTKDNQLFTVLYLNILAQIIDIVWFYQGIELFKKILLRNYIIKLSGLIMIFLFVKSPNDLLLYALIIQGSSFLGNLSLWFGLRKRIQKIDIRKINPFKHWRKSFTYFIPTVATSIYTVLDKSMLGWFTDTSFENGYYEQTHKIVLVVVTVVTSLSVVLMPRVAYLFLNNQMDEMKRKIETAIKFVLMLTVAMTSGLFGISKNLIPWFLGAGYDECIILLRIFSFIVVAIGLNNIVGMQCLTANGKQKQYNIGVIIGAIINFLMNLLLIPKFYSVGAAIASVLAEFSILLCFCWFSSGVIDYPKIYLRSWKYYVSGIVMLCVELLINSVLLPNVLSIAESIFIGCLVYFGLLIALRDSFVYHYFTVAIRRLVPNKKNID